MINLLPYSKRNSLKSSYKRRLIVVVLISINLAFLPFAAVLSVMVFTEYQNLNILKEDYQNIKTTRTDQGVTELSQNVDDVNMLISSFQKNLKEIKPTSGIFEKILLVKPKSIKIMFFDSGSIQDNTVFIYGTSENREAIIEYSDLLKSDKYKICNRIDLPVTTYKQKNNVPFTISCSLYEK